jgi:hypothetical protein
MWLELFFKTQNCLQTTSKARVCHYPYAKGIDPENHEGNRTTESIPTALLLLSEHDTLAGIDPEDEPMDEF